MQGVPGLGAQRPGCLLLLEVLDEGHGSVGAGQVVASCGRGRNERKIFEDGQRKRNQTEPTDHVTSSYVMEMSQTKNDCLYIYNGLMPQTI